MLYSVATDDYGSDGYSVLYLNGFDFQFFPSFDGRSERFAQSRFLFFVGFNPRTKIR